MYKLLFLALIMAVISGFLIVNYLNKKEGFSESAPYSVIRTVGNFELRDYLQLTLVETEMSGEGNETGGSFNRLFKYIQGGNQAELKIPMTTPVFMSAHDSKRNMAFVLPQQMAAESVPQPVDASVKVREMPAGRFAVLRFSGVRSAELEAEMLLKLRAWVLTEKIAVKDEPVYGYFNPPWTPSFLRRNEVMLPLLPAMLDQ